MKTRVTGGAGSIGSHLVDRSLACLLADGREVIVVDHFDAFDPRTDQEANLAGSIAWYRSQPGS